MRRITSCLSLAALSLALVSSAAFAQGTITIGSGQVGPGETVSIDITLNDGGTMIAGTENQIGFPDEVTIGGCSRNELIGKDATAFAGTNPLTALVLSLGNTDAIPDGSVMYSCDATAAADAADGDYTIECIGAGASDPTGNSIDADCVNGTITVVGPPSGSIDVGSASGLPGSTVAVEVSLTVADGEEIVGTENVLTFAASVQAVTSGTVSAASDVQLRDCARNEAIGKDGTAFSFQPSGCTEGSDCESLKALVLSLGNTDPIPTGSVLYTCQAAISSNAQPGTVTLGCSEPGASDSNGNPLNVECNNGSVTIEEEPTPIPTATPMPTEAPTDTPENTVMPTDPPDPTSTPIPTVDDNNEDDDSCAIVAPQSSSSGWMLLLPLAGLLWLRRRND